MRTRRTWWVAGGLVGALVLGLWGAYTWRLQQANQQLALTVEAERQRNFHALAGHMQNLEVLLAKGLASGSARQNLHYMGEVRRHTGAAISHFTGLPLPGPVSAATGKFLSQVGDFAYTLARQEAAGRPMSAADRQQLAQLQEAAANVNAALQDVALRVLTGGYRWQTATATGPAGLFRAALPTGKPSADPQNPTSLLPGGLAEIGGQAGLDPGLVYDGPFSDHVARRQPAVSGPPVTREAAQASLDRFLPAPERWRLAQVAEGDGALPTWSFRLVPAAGNAGADSPGPALTVDLAKAGGHLVQLLGARAPGPPTLDLARARDLGRDYLAAAGFPGMEPTYAEVAGGFATIQYAYRQGEVLIYPDQVRVKVALDNGEVVAVNAADYLMSHHPRRLPAPRVSPEEAQAALNVDLEVEQVQLALIPDASGTGELLAYEFRASLGADTFLVYVNAATGAEERILQLLEAETGTRAL